MELFYKSYGTGEPLIILHGLFGSSDNWQGLSRHVFAKHFQVLIPDLRNHGRSPHSEVFSYSAMVEVLVHFFGQHGLPSADVIGHSLGGKTAMLFALTYPEKVKKLVVVDIAPKEYPPKHLEIFGALRDLKLENELNAALPPDQVFEGPTLFISGSNSDYVTNEDLAGIRRLFPNAEIATVKSAGHWVHFDQPEAFARLVRDWLYSGGKAKQ